MFQKLVSGVSFSPALAGHLNAYAKNMRKDLVLRRFGLIFTALALAIQSFAVFSAPEQALAQKSGDMIAGGVPSLHDAVQIYDADATKGNDFAAALTYFGVSRAELAQVKSAPDTICAHNSDAIMISRQPHFSANEGVATHNVPKATSGTINLYATPLENFTNTSRSPACHEVYTGNSSKIGWFAIGKKNGNIFFSQNHHKIVRGHFTAASCTTVQGFAYDENSLNRSAFVYLYFNGPPGVGEQYGPVQSNDAQPSSPHGSGYGFSFTVPSRYQNTQQATEIWAVVQHTTKSTPYTVQFDNTATIPAGCNTTTPKLVECYPIKIDSISRVEYQITAWGRADYGANIQNFVFKVYNSDKEIIHESTNNDHGGYSTSPVFTTVNPGDYIAQVTITTDTDGLHAECQQPIQVADVDRCYFNNEININDPLCAPCQYDSSTGPYNEHCRPPLVQSKTVRNLSANENNLTTTSAAPNERLEYTIHTKNIGNTTLDVTISEDLTGALQYAQLLDPLGGVLDNNTNTISWGNVSLKPGALDTRSFITQINSSIAGTPVAANNPAVYNCMITNTYGNTTYVHVPCPLIKRVEGFIAHLPKLNQTTNIIFGIVILVTTTFLYFRSRQLNKEIRLIKRKL